MSSAIRYIASSTKSALGSLHLNCHVTPGSSKQREGISSVTDTIIGVCVSAQPKNGTANKAACELFSKVLNVPKSDVKVVRGLKSRDKVIVVAEVDLKGDEEALVSRIREVLEERYWMTLSARPN